MLPREGWNVDDPNQSAHPCLSVKKLRLQQDCEQVMERAPRQMCAAIFKKKNVVGEKATKSAYD